MNIQELDSYNLADAVKFNDQLNPRLWGRDEHLKPQVRRRLLEIAEDFREFLGIKDLDLRDITISGSNAAYTYTPNSDIDLHLVVDMPKDEVYRELFDAKKFQYNEQHNITIGGYDVELYVQDAAQPHVSQGIYSIANNDWVQVPRRVKSNVDDASTRNKFETVGHQIEKAIASGSLKQMTRMAEKIKRMRQTGLEQHGEFGPENLAFKMLRSQGKIKELYDARNAAKDRALSLKEEPKKPFVYGFKEDADLTPDGVNPTTCMFLNEDDPISDEDILQDFVDFCVKELKIEQMPRVKLRKDPQWPVVHKTFGRYIDDVKMLEVAWGHRHIMDVLRTVAHELTHKHQHERDGSRMGPDAGETGSPYENEANARAGILMRDYARLHPEYFAHGQADELTGLEEGELDEGVKEKAAAIALAACMTAGGTLSGCATQPSVQGGLRTVQDVGRTVQTAQHMTRAGAQEELGQELRNFVRATGGDPGSQNQSFFYRLLKKQQPQQPQAPQAQTSPTGASAPAPAPDEYENPIAKLRRQQNESASVIQRQLPPKLVIGGYTFVLDPNTRKVTVTHGGRPFTTYQYTGPKNYNTYVTNAEHIIAGTQPKDLADIAKRDRGSPTAAQRSFEYPTDSNYQVSIPNQDLDRVYRQHDQATAQHGVVGGISDFGKFSAIAKRRKAMSQNQDDEVKESASGSYPEVLYHGSTQEIKGPLTPRQAHDIGGAKKSNKNAIYATDDPNFAIAYSLAERGSDTGTLGWKQDPHLIFFGGKIRHGQNVYLYTLPTRDAQGNPLFAQGGADAEWYSVPGVTELKPIEVEEVPVDQYLGLLRKPTPDEQKIFQANKAKDKSKQPQGVEESASGYIPTKKQARDPRYSMALTQDIRPGQVGKEANKLKLKTDSQGHPQIANPNGLFEKLSLELEQFKKKNRLAESAEQLDEVKMSPSALQKWANSAEAQGIRAGFEAELIFRDTTNDGDDDYEMEPDYDADERCRSIQDIIDFFNNGEYGGLSPRQERALQEGLDEQYFEWQDEQMYASWRDERDDLIREAWLREKPLDERIHAALVDGMELTDEQADAVVALHDARSKKEITGPELTDEQLEMARQYSEARSIADDILDEDVEQTIAKEDGFYDEVLQDFRDGFYVDDDSGFFDDVGLRWMSDVANSFDLDWPYMTGGGGNDGSRDWESIGDSLHSVIDMPVKVSSNYHQTTRREGVWIVEPDSSLQPDDREDYGLEIVSPPMPLLTALEKLQEVCDWANSNEGNAYTNSSTGLHMGVSVPFKGGDVDYLKLILFLGDEYVLQQFGREANTYTKSAMKGFRENIKSGRADPAGAMKLMQHGLLELAQKEIQKGVGQGKYTSAHIQDGYIEFRSAGGDWLAEESADPEKLSSTMLRYARAMQIAADPSTDRREYAKKLYKLVAPEGDSQLALFSQYAAGELTAEQLKTRWAEKTIGTEKKMNQRWKLYQKIDGRWEPVPAAEWNGYTEDQVKNAVWSKYGREALDSGEYQLVNMGEQDWEVYDVNTGKTLEIVKGKSKGEVADAVYDKYVNQGIGFQVRPYEDPATMTPRAKLAKRITQTKKPTEYNYEIVNLGDVNLRVVDKFYAANKQEADKTFDKWLSMKGLPNDTDNYGYRPRKQEPEQSADDRQDSAHLQATLTRTPEPPSDATNRVGSWSIYDVTLGREISRMDNVPWSQADARANELEQSTGHNMSVRGLSEAVDAVSGTGAIARAIAGAKPPSPVPVRRKDPAVKLDIKNKPLDPYAQTYTKLPVNETLPAKNLNQLYTIKRQLANPAFSTAEPAPAAKPVPAKPAQPRVHTALADLQRQRDKVQQLMNLKQEIETLTARAGRTRYGLTPGLAADIEDIYPNPQTEADMDAAIQGYEVQKKKLADYIARQRKVFPKESVVEGVYDADTYDLPRRTLNVPELIKRGAIFVVDPHGPNGWEPDAEGSSLVTLWNVANGGWPAEARQHLKPSMYKAAESKLNRQGPGSMVYDGKYNQILWSIKKLGIPDEVAFLDQINEIARIPQSELGGWGDKDTLEPMTTPPKNRKPLPGGSGYIYAVNRGDPEFMEIMIFDGDTLAAELDLFATLDPLKTWRVETVITDPDYRGKGMGKALYGIALSILKLTIEAGEQQTKFGQAMWLMLDSIPGVEVLGYAMESTDRYRPKPGDKVVDQNDTWTRYTFPVEPGRRSMRSQRPGTGIYSSQHVSMIAKWTGQ